MFTFILLSKFDNYTIEKKKLIQFSYNHLLNNLEKYNLEAEILIVDMGSKLGYLCDNKIFTKYENSLVKTKFLNLTHVNPKILESLDYRTHSSEALEIGIQNAKYENVILKNQDTICDENIFEFLKKNKFDKKNYFYNTF